MEIENPVYEGMNDDNLGDESYINNQIETQADIHAEMNPGREDPETIELEERWNTYRGESTTDRQAR